MTRSWTATRAGLWAVITLIGIAVIASAGFVLTLFPPGPEPNTPRYEVMRVCLQVLGVALIGVVVGMATFRLQQIHLEQSKIDAEKRDHNADERQRLDDRIRLFLSDTILGYNALKQIRRTLEAETAPKSLPVIRYETYSRLLRALNEQQLTFESLKRRTPLIQGRVPGGEEIKVYPCDGPAYTETLRQHYAHVEHYLNKSIEEYQKNLHRTSPEKTASLDELGLNKLKEFIYKTDKFRDAVSDRVEAVIRILESELLNPGTARSSQQ